MKKILTIVGARPQFIKAAAVSRAIRERFSGGVREVLVHTGQHFDENMSHVFFDELEIPEPAYNLGIAGGGHGAMTGRMLAAIETVMLDERPDWVLIYGDTNSTLAGALAAAKLHIPVAHVEAGLRSFNMRMPEEVNRVLADRVSDLLLCPTEAAVANLRREGMEKGVLQVGDVMYDIALRQRDRARKESRLLDSLGLRPKGFALATCHRAENTDDLSRLRGICAALASLAVDLPVVFPVHPRTRKVLEMHELVGLLRDVTLVEPVAYIDMVALEQAAQIILTDSGGVQKEAFFYGVPCVTLRDETEWVETVASGWNVLAGSSEAAIASAAKAMLTRTASPPRSSPYGDGASAHRIVEAILNHH